MVKLSKITQNYEEIYSFFSKLSNFINWVILQRCCVLSIFCHEKQGIASQPLKATFRADVVYFSSCDFFNSKEYY